MADQKELDVKLFDVRTVKRNIKKNYITDDDYRSFTDSLEDKAENAELCETDQAEFIGEREERRRQREEARAAKEGNSLDNDLKIG